MFKSNLFCALVALITAVTISSAFAKGYLSHEGGIVVTNEAIKLELKK